MRKETKHRLSEFRAIYCSGIYIPGGDAVTALSLLFQKVFIPNNVELIKEFSKKFIIKAPAIPCNGNYCELVVRITKKDGSESNLFNDLTTEQKITAYEYLKRGWAFWLFYAPLYGEVFETNLFEKGKFGGLKVGDDSPQMILPDEGECEEVFPSLVTQGYIPIIGHYNSEAALNKNLDTTTAKQLAALLAMKSIQLLFPATKSARPEVILEARDRLSSHLPPFWSSMLKLSVELKRRIHECKSMLEVIREGEDLIETTVRPALIDLVEKMNKERERTGFTIFSHLFKRDYV